MERLVVYSTDTCPSCKNLKRQLDSKKIKYDEFNDKEKMIELGIDHIPVLEVDGTKLSYKQALDWIKER